MTNDINLFGLFLNAGLATAALAALLLLAVRRTLAWLGAYRFVWHPALVDLALFLVLWLAVSLLMAAFGEHALFILG